MIQISNNLPYDDLTKLMSTIYESGEIKVKDHKGNKYLYFMNNYNTNYRFVSASKLLINYGAVLPGFLKDYLKAFGDSVVLPNIINGIVYSLTFRNISGKKQFLKMGSTSHLLYGLGTLPENFVYGIPLLIVEGNMDCDSIRQLYPYTVATLTNTLSLNQIRLLAHLTDKVVIAYDNDEAGNKGYWNTYNALNRYGFKIKRFRHSDNVKDFGDLIDKQLTDTDMYNHLRKLYIKRLQELLDSF